MSISKGAFRHVESELFAYPDTKREIEKIRTEILAPYDERSEDTVIVKGKNSVRKPGDPTGRTATALAANRKLEQLERIADVIAGIVDELPDQKRRMLRLRYWTKPQTRTWDGIAMELGCNRTTVIRWRNGIVQEIAKRIGWR